MQEIAKRGEIMGVNYSVKFMKGAEKLFKVIPLLFWGEL